METNVIVESDGLKLSGRFHCPDNLGTNETRPAFICTHGFGGSKIDGSMASVCPWLCDKGYIALCLDSRGCGESAGQRGNIIPQEQVLDLGHALTWLAKQDGVDAERIVLLGDSLGAAVSLFAGGTDQRVAGVVAVGGWGNGAAKIALQHAGPGMMDKYLEMLANGKAHREQHGTEMMVSRFDIVPIPEHMRGNLPEDAIMEFTAATAQAIYDFRPSDVIGNLAPRPLLLVHASRDRVTPTDSSIEVWGYANLPKDMVLLSDVDHFPLAVGNARIYDVIAGWLDLYFPLS